MGEFLGAYFTPNGSYLMQDAEDGRQTKQLDALAQVRSEIDTAAPDALLVVSPHWLPRRSFYVEKSSRLTNVNDYPLLPQRFGRRYFDYEIDGDPHLAESIIDASRETGVPVEAKEYGIDHGAFTVLRVMKNTVPVVLASTGFRSHEESAEWGRTLRAGIEQSNRRVVVICPGNLSHRLDLRDDVEEEDYDPRMRAFDESALRLLEEGRYGTPLQDIPEDVFNAASPETGLRTFPILWGVTSGVPGELMEYVGYKFSIGDAIVRFPAINTNKATVGVG